MRLTKRMEDGSYQANNDTEFGGENSYSYKNAVIEKLGKYEDIHEDPEYFKFLNTCCCTTTE